MRDQKDAAARRLVRVIVGGLASGMLLTGCVWLPLGQKSSSKNGYQASAIHKVKPGETLDTIANGYGTTPQAIASRNRLATNQVVAAGSILQIPGQKMSAESVRSKAWWNPLPQSFSTGLAGAARIIGPKNAPCPRPTTGEGGPIRAFGAPESATRGSAAGRVPVNFAAYEVCAREGQASQEGFCWPVLGRVSRPFDEAISHKGLDICAPEGTPIRASRSGKVIYSGNELRGYGNMIILEHSGRLASVYGHNRRNLVRVGQTVSRGQVIGEVGQTGNATTPHVHFEVRRDATPVDPRPMLP